MAKVVRLFGKADNFNIEFSREGRAWKTDIPPDMTDGVYAVQLTAVDELGETAYWVGELFMCSGVCHLKIERMYADCVFSAESYRMKTSSLHRTEFSVQEYSSTFSKNISIRFSAEERKLYEVRFSVSDRLCFSKDTDTDFSVKKLRINGNKKKMLMHKSCILSIGKECSYV